MGECRHGMEEAWCADCRTPRSPVPVVHERPVGGVTKQEVLDGICARLGVRAQHVGVGSSVPSAVFAAVSGRLGLAGGSMPEVAEAAVRAAGLEWTADCDSRGTVSGGGSTVTLAGLVQLERALALLL